MNITPAQKLAYGRLGLHSHPDNDLAIFIHELDLRVGIDLVLAPKLLRDGHLSFASWSLHYQT